eukprot:2859929-Pleurochrysis_carterae.AAC.3
MHVWSSRSLNTCVCIPTHSCRSYGVRASRSDSLLRRTPLASLGLPDACLPKFSVVGPRLRALILAFSRKFQCWLSRYVHMLLSVLSVSLA